MFIIRRFVVLCRGDVGTVVAVTATLRGAGGGEGVGSVFVGDVHKVRVYMASCLSVMSTRLGFLWPLGIAFFGKRGVGMSVCA